jgi:TonB-dependent SusC/RagA subfamily outer membrane receptor
MSEVVVVAYGNQRKESITGSVAVVSAEQLQTRMTTNITQALAGAAPGITATSGNGQPGSSAAIRIRGFGSVNASNSPLYVVDGFPYEGFIGDLNTNDIESISLLKDASSTALYGARAANGVVMVTTKKGKKGFPKINVTATRVFLKEESRSMIK